MSRIIRAYQLPRWVFEVGCGNGATAEFLSRELNVQTNGIDINDGAIAAAKARDLEGCSFHQLSVYDRKSVTYGNLPFVLALEVIEHCPDAWGFMAAIRENMTDDGIAIISTPYHGWLKNVLLALSGSFDRHFDPLWRGGHLKFFSIVTMTRLCEESGLKVVDVLRVGRVPLLAKSMIFVLSRRR